MTQSRAAICDSSFLQVLSIDSVESYTTRSFQAAITDGLTISSCVPERVREREGEEGEDKAAAEISLPAQYWKEWLKMVSVQ